MTITVQIQAQTHRRMCQSPSSPSSWAQPSSSSTATHEDTKRYQPRSILIRTQLFDILWRARVCSVLATSFLMSPFFVVLRDVWIRTLRVDLASRRASNLATHPLQLSYPSPYLATHPPIQPPFFLLGHPSPCLAIHPSTQPPIPL